MSELDTIVALATPPGESALACVRLSGSKAVEIADRLFRPSGRGLAGAGQAQSHLLRYGHVVSGGAIVDEVMLVVMRSPRTFTREDMVEIHAHGNPLITRKLLGLCVEHGARIALPGEFTKRAFLHGRLDLAQAEAVADLIRSRTELSLAAAQDQLAGKLSERIHRIRDSLIGTLAHVEAHLDFPDEDIQPATRAELVGRLRAARAEMQQLLATAEEGQVLRDGVRAVIVGRPNVGKSSFLNQLLGSERAIVASTPGTTRDTIEETANIRGIPVVLTDTAGLREAGDAIEAEGVRRSHAALNRADLILHVLDGSEPLDAVDVELIQRHSKRKRILLLNKSDLGRRLAFPGADPGPLAEISCLSGAGLEAMKDVLAAVICAGWSAQSSERVTVSARHRHALSRAEQACGAALDALASDLALDLVALDLRICTTAVGEIVGKTATEDLLDSIFSQFCIGK